MRFIFLFIAIAFISSTSYGQRSLQNTLRKYKNDNGVVSVNYKDEINDLFLKKNPKLKTRIEFVDVVVFNNNSDISTSDKQEIKLKLNSEKFDLLVNAKQKDGKLELYTQGPDSEISYVFANVKADKYNAYFIMKGKIVMDEIPQLGLDFQGADLLKNFAEKF